MRRFFSTFLAVISLLVTIAFGAGCEEIENKFVYKEVQKISYALGNGRVTKTSQYFCQYEIQEATEQEYLNASNKCNYYDGYYTSGDIQLDKTVEGKNGGEDLTIEELKKYIKQTYYMKVADGWEVDENFHYVERYSYKKIKYTGLIISCINIKFIDKNNFEIKYYDEQAEDFVTQKINSDNYEISYFIE